MENLAHALARDELIRALTAYTGVATADGAVGGDTIVDSALIGMNDFVSEKAVLIMSGPAAREDKGAASFNNVTGTITLQSGFSAQITRGTIYRILNISSVEIDVANINTKIGTNVDAPGTTTLFAWLAKLFQHGGQGLVYYGVVTDVPGANQFTIPTLTGFGDTAFCDWYAYVFWDTAGVDAPPQREQQAIATYDSATGIFSTAPFTAPVAVGDIILILHPRIAEIATILADMNVPAADAVANAIIRDVIGNKGDTYLWSPTATGSIIRYLKGLLHSSGLIYRAVVTDVPNATTFRASELIGYGSTFFRNWSVYVIWDAAGLGGAPQDEYTQITAFNSADATFTHAAFTAQLAVGDKVLLLHPWLARIADLTRPQAGTQATTNVLSVIGAAIEGTVPFKVSGYLSLHNMQAGDTFLLIEEIRDQDDVTYREYARHSYSDVQTSPMIWFEPKVCQGWRVRIQRTAGADRDVTYQFFREVASA